MRFVDAVLLLLTIYDIKTTDLDELVSGKDQLCDILQKTSNITYFEPAGYNRDSVIAQHKVACRRPTHSTVVIELFAFQRYFTLIVHQDVDLFGKDIVVTTHSKHHGISKVAISFNEFYYGKVSGDPWSYVTLRIHNGIIDGLYYTQEELYYIEPSSRYFHQPVPFHSLVYKSTDVNFNLSTVKTSGHQASSHTIGKLSQHHIMKTLNKATANTCALHIAGDHHLFKQFGKGSLEDTIAEMVFHIGEADKIFRSTNFDGDGGPGDNIGFTIAAITVYQDDSGEDSFVAPASTDEIMELLVAWSSLRHDAFCLSVLFTYQDFSNGVLGLAWVGDLNNGGICSKRVIPQNSTEEINFNTAVVTLLNGKSTVPRKASIVTITHELGHSFGASHDPSECRPGDDTGNYIMHETATQGDKPNNYFFSKCSKDDMWPVINYKGSQCFIAHHRGIYCGNKIVEEGEECDCGYPHECETIDTCCDHGNMTSGVPSCKVKHGYQCSPLKGSCCTQDCHFITSQDAICQKETECTFHSMCNLSSATCPPAIVKPINTTCNHGSNTCFHGDCTGPICSAYNMEQCECTGYDSLCHVCCQHHKKGCISASSLTGKDIYQFVGSLCANMTGYCDEYGQCIIVDVDNHYNMLVQALKRLTSKVMIRRFTTWANANWCPMLVLWCCILVVMVMLKCQPIILLRQSIRRHLLVQPEPVIPFNDINGQTDNVQTMTDDKQTDSGD